MATLDYFPMRANGQLLPFLPAPLGRFAMTMDDWLDWRVTRMVEDAQRVNWAYRRPQALAAADH